MSALQKDVVEVGEAGDLGASTGRLSLEVDKKHRRCLAMIHECGTMGFAARRMRMSKIQLLGAVAEIEALLGETVVERSGESIWLNGVGFNALDCCDAESKGRTSVRGRDCRDHPRR